MGGAAAPTGGVETVTAGRAVGCGAGAGVATGEGFAVGAGVGAAVGAGDGAEVGAGVGAGTRSTPFRFLTSSRTEAFSGGSSAAREKSP